MKNKEFDEQAIPFNLNEAARQKAGARNTCASVSATGQTRACPICGAVGDIKFLRVESTSSYSETRVVELQCNVCEGRFFVKIKTLNETGSS